MWDALKNRSESLMHLKKAEGSRSSRCCRWCIQFTSPAVFLSLPLIGIDASPNQGEHYRSAKVLEMTRFTERQSCISAVDFFYTDERFTESCSGKEEHAKQQHSKFQALSVYTVCFFAVYEPWVLTMLSQIQFSEWLHYQLKSSMDGYWT